MSTITRSLRDNSKSRPERRLIIEIVDFAKEILHVSVVIRDSCKNLSDVIK